LTTNHPAHTFYLDVFEVLMDRRSFVLLLLAALLSFLPFAAASCVQDKQIPQTEEFANVERISGESGLEGLEITLEERGSSVLATLKDYEGNQDPLIAKLNGTIHDAKDGCYITLYGRNDRGEVEIRGTIRAAMLDATITRTIQQLKYIQKFSLKRKTSEKSGRAG
jgi:hypothetical protein